MNNFPLQSESFLLETKIPVNNNFSNINVISQSNMNSSPIQSNVNNNIYSNVNSQLNMNSSTVQSNPNVVSSNKALSFENLRPIQSNMQNIYQESQNENSFLNKVLDEDQKLLDNISEDLLKIMKNIEQINEKNNTLKIRLGYSKKN